MKINLWNFEISIHRKPKRLYTKDELVNIKMTRDEFAKKVTGCIRNACHAHPTMGYKDFAGKSTTLRDSIRGGRLIECIKILREYFGLSLRDAKDIACDNMTEWQRILGKEEPRTSASYQTASGS